MPTPNRQPAFDAKRFKSALDELAAVPRDPRPFDVLVENQDRIVERLRAGNHDKDIYEALRTAGFKISYPGFLKAMKQFRDALHLPSRRQMRMDRLHAGRFLAPSEDTVARERSPAAPPPRAGDGTVKKGKLAALAGASWASRETKKLL